MAPRSFEVRIEKACADLEVTGAVVVGGSSDGTYRYEKAFGKRSLEDANADALKIDSCMWIASCTKLITTIATMQCVEKGLLKLDEDVTTILHELKGVKILTGFDETTGEPNLVENKKTITLRHLLTHSSGLSYDTFNPLLVQYSKWLGREPSLHLNRRPEEQVSPLLFAPGEQWEYSVGIDWAGVMVERVSNNISLEEYMLKNIWAPLGVKTFTFHPNTVPAIKAKMTDMSQREGGVHPLFGVAINPEGNIDYTDDTVWNWDSPGCHGGAGSFTNLPDYQKMLQSICADDGRLLKSETIDLMFTPQLTQSSIESLMLKLTIPEVNASYGSLPTGTKVTWGLGGQMIMEDLPGDRRKGTMAWVGYPNLHWFIDRASGMSGVYGSQLIPCGDLKTNELYVLWIKEMYRQAGKDGTVKL